LRIEELVWLEDIVEKLQSKHQVEVHEVVETLSGRPLFRLLEKGHRKGEHLYLGLSRSDAGRYLAVFFVFKEKNSALIVSARDMKPRERRQYGQSRR